MQHGNKAYNQITTRVFGLSGRTKPLHFDLTIVSGVLGRYKRGRYVKVSESLFEKIINELRRKEQIYLSYFEESGHKESTNWLLTDKAIYISGPVAKELSTFQRHIQFINLSLIDGVEKCSHNNIFFTIVRCISGSNFKYSI